MLINIPLNREDIRRPECNTANYTAASAEFPITRPITGCPTLFLGTEPTEATLNYLRFNTTLMLKLYIIHVIVCIRTFIASVHLHISV